MGVAPPPHHTHTLARRPLVKTTRCSRHQPSPEHRRGSTGRSTRLRLRLRPIHPFAGEPRPLCPSRVPPRCCPAPPAARHIAAPRRRSHTPRGSARVPPTPHARTSHRMSAPRTAPISQRALGSPRARGPRPETARGRRGVLVSRGAALRSEGLAVFGLLDDEVAADGVAAGGGGRDLALACQPAARDARRHRLVPRAGADARRGLVL